MLSTLERLAKTRELRVAAAQADSRDVRERVIAQRRAEALRALLLGQAVQSVEDLELFDPKGALRTIGEAWAGMAGEPANRKTKAAAYLRILTSYLRRMEDKVRAPHEPYALDGSVTGDIELHAHRRHDAEFKRAQFDEYAAAGQDVAAIPAKMADALAEVGAIDAQIHDVLDKQRAVVTARYKELQPMRDAAFSSWDDVEAGRITREEGKARRDAYNAADAAMREAVEAEFAPRQNELREQRRQAELRYSAHAAELKRGIIAASPITEEQAQDWAWKQQITPTAAARLKKMGYPLAQARADMAEFYRLTGGRLATVTIDSKGERRANAEGIHGHSSSIINMGSRFDKRVLFHELAHHLERDPLALAAANGFLEKRRESDTRWSLRSLTGNRGYGPKEAAYKDKWFDAYVGKVYADATEVMSMGLESFCDDAMLANRIKADPEHFALMVGFMRTPPDPLFRSVKKVFAQIDEAETEIADVQDREGESALKRMAALVNFEPREEHSDPWWMGAYGAKYLGSWDYLEAWDCKTVRDPKTKRKKKAIVLVLPKDWGGAMSYCAYFNGLDEAKAAALVWKKTGNFVRLTDPATVLRLADAHAAA